MIEKIKAVNNPLTIIAIFAALAEVAGTVALKLVSESHQGTFIWFVMLFPTLIVLLFFLTLNFNPKVLYAPSDFRNEENFLNTIGSVKQLSLDLEKVETQLATVSQQITQEAVNQIDIANENGRRQLAELVSSKIASIQQSVETTKENADGALQNLITDNDISIVRYSGLDMEKRARARYIRNKIPGLLREEGRAMTTSEIANALAGRGINIGDRKALIDHLNKLTELGLIWVNVSEGEPKYGVFLG